MAVLSGLISLVAGMAQDHLDLGEQIGIGPLLTGSCIVVQAADDEEKSTVFLNKKRLYTVPLLFLRKSTDQQVCINELDLICGYLSSLSAYQQSSGFELVDIAVKNQPYFMEKDESGFFIYGAKILCRVYG